MLTDTFCYLEKYLRRNIMNETLLDEVVHLRISEFKKG